LRVYVVIPKKYSRFIDEELALVKTLYSDRDIVGYSVVKSQPRKAYLSSRRIEELKKLEFDKLIVMDRLKPSQLVNLAREIRRDVVDRVLLILEVFAAHAGSREALLQIELAKLKYTLPLVKEAIRYAKLGELHGFLGAGRYGYEKYYLMLKKKEARLRREAENLRLIRDVQRRARRDLGLPHVIIVGYTCAGKTSLFNAITNLSLPVGPEPFTTLTPKAYRVNYRDVSFILVDTVGFIRDVPPEIIEAFYATLEEVAEADLIINVVDASKPIYSVLYEIATGSEILRKIGAHGKPVIYALNKIDKVSPSIPVLEEVAKYIGSSDAVIPVSCTKGININVLLERVRLELSKRGFLSEENIRFKIWSQA
jgi:GTP-binding protein HflX